MASFLPAFVKTLDSEGGYVDHPADRGGPTKYGISSRQYPNLNIKSLALADVMEIYQRDYWDHVGLDRIRSQEVAEEIFDTAVVMGPKAAVEIVQRSLCYLGNDVTIDGLMGPLTVESLNEYSHERDLLKTLNGVQFMAFLKIVEADPTQLANARGWLKRIKL